LINLTINTLSFLILLPSAIICIPSIKVYSDKLFKSKLIVLNSLFKLYSKQNNSSDLLSLLSSTLGLLIILPYNFSYVLSNTKLPNVENKSDNKSDELFCLEYSLNNEFRTINLDLKSLSEYTLIEGIHIIAEGNRIKNDKVFIVKLIKYGMIRDVNLIKLDVIKQMNMNSFKNNTSLLKNPENTKMKIFVCSGPFTKAGENAL
jgi:hypothetical protein